MLFLVCECKDMTLFLHIQTFKQKNAKKNANSFLFFVDAS